MNTPNHAPPQAAWMDEDKPRFAVWPYVNQYLGGRQEVPHAKCYDGCESWVEFQEEYRQARNKAVAQSLGRLQQGSGAAATVMLKIMLDPANPAASRLHAADRVIQHSKDHVEMEDFALRLRRLEQVATEKKDAEPLDPL